MLPAGESEFAGQPTQPEFPVPDLYVPPKHCVHVPPLGPFHPALQMQAATAVLPAGELESAGQPTQPEFPVPDLYVPPKHCVHLPPSGPLDPALHTHAVIVELETGDMEFVGQLKQVKEEDAGRRVKPESPGWALYNTTIPDPPPASKK